jgi:hypothetical protein
MKIFLKFLSLSLLCFLFGCSGIINHAIIKEQREATLLRAGFKPLPITTAQEEQQFKKLRPGKITTVTHDGKTYFLYPDLEEHRLLIGRNKQFMQYNQLVTDQLVGPAKSNRKIEREWEQSGVWNNMNGWGTVGLDDPFFLPY